VRSLLVAEPAPALGLPLPITDIGIAGAT